MAFWRVLPFLNDSLRHPPGGWTLLCPMPKPLEEWKAALDYETEIGAESSSMQGRRSWRGSRRKSPGTGRIHEPISSLVGPLGIILTAFRT